MTTKQQEGEYLHMRIPKKLKEDFLAVCKERGFSLSDGVRDLMTKELRNYKRKGIKAPTE